MPSTEELTVAHYARAELEQAVLAGLEALGAGSTPTTDDLAAVDEFHMGGHAATIALTAGLPLSPETRVLDIGASAALPVTSPQHTAAVSPAST